MEIIRELRKKKGLTQQQLAEKVGISNVSLSNYERGTQMPDLNTLARIAVELDVSTDILLGISGEVTETEVPKTPEARIMAAGMDKLPKEMRTQALEIMQAVYVAHADDFRMKGNEDETEL